jgi:hypothetical protein
MNELKLRPSTDKDIKHLAECLRRDPWHRKEKLEDWVNVTGGLSTVYDHEGAIFHLAFTEEGRTLRLHAQFDPRQKFKTAHGIVVALGWIGLTAQGKFDKLAIWSESPDMVEFMRRLGFEREGEDFVLPLQRTN